MDEGDRAESDAFLEHYVEACVELAIKPLAAHELAELVAWLVDDDLGRARLH
jgi:hypothetical protein